LSHPGPYAATPLNAINHLLAKSAPNSHPIFLPYPPMPTASKRKALCVFDKLEDALRDGSQHQILLYIIYFFKLS
jgi:hypothetical protein